MPTAPSFVIRNVNLATLPSDHDWGEVRDAALVVQAGRIAWLGSQAELPVALAQGLPTVNGQQGWLTPGLIDCHTHLVYAGNRSMEAEQRWRGDSYTAIAQAGGGIVSTMRATRAACLDDLIAQSEPRLMALMAEGVTTVEIKSGYGLDLESEARMLMAARLLGQRHGLRVTTTFLGAHALPPEFKGRPDDYIDHLIHEQLPELHRRGLVDAVDAFCESIAFSPEQVSRLFDAAKRLGLPVKLHADQLSDLGGAGLAARYQALSADHVEHTQADAVAAMAASGTVAVLLPGAFYAMRETQKPPIAALRASGVPMAVATDCNPGTSPFASLRWMMHMACTFFGLTAIEALRGTTAHAAQALGLQAQTGRLAPGYSADLALWAVHHPRDIVCSLNHTALRQAWAAGASR